MFYNVGLFVMQVSTIAPMLL